MAMSSASGAGLSNEPNVTPMIDVLLVLLIIFMAVLPSMRKAIDIQLPDPNPTVVPQNSKSDQIVLEIHPNKQYAINTEAVSGTANLNKRLHDIYDQRPEKILFVKGDSTVKYADIIEAMDISRGAIGVHAVIGVAPKDTPSGAGGAAPATK
jgi:biopolymer transport protein ExbD